jgi:hypothetical protein
VTFLKVSKDGYTLKRLERADQCKTWQYLILPEDLSVNRAGNAIYNTAPIHAAYLAVPDTTPDRKYATCCIQENGNYKWNIMIQDSIVAQEQVIDAAADLDRLLASCMTKQFTFTLFAHPDAQ